VEEIANPRIVAATVHNLVLKVPFVVLQFVLDVRQLSVEFILPGSPRFG
jgi:hypothetical protein